MLNLGANDYNEAMEVAAREGHRDIVERMLKLGANDYNWAMAYAIEGGHQDIVDLINQYRQSHQHLP